MNFFENFESLYKNDGRLSKLILAENYICLKLSGLFFMYSFMEYHSKLISIADVKLKEMGGVNCSDFSLGDFIKVIEHSGMESFEEVDSLLVKLKEYKKGRNKLTHRIFELIKHNEKDLGCSFKEMDIFIEKYIKLGEDLLADIDVLTNFFGEIGKKLGLEYYKTHKI